jgi:DNA-binding response OmpR family regulator
MNIKRILLVDDDKCTAECLKCMLLMKKNIIIDIVESGIEAIQKSRVSPPDLILMDIDLVGQLDGIISYKQIKESVNIPVIFISAHSDEEILAKALQCEPIAYFNKPINISELMTTIEELFANT